MGRILRKFVRLEAEVEAREGRLPLGQRLENCKLERGIRTAETPKDELSLQCLWRRVVANTDEAICKRKANVQRGRRIGRRLSSNTAEKQSHEKEDQGDMEKDEGKREETAQIPDADR